jgi:hypothetical protein
LVHRWTETAAETLGVHTPNRADTGAVGDGDGDVANEGLSAPVSTAPSLSPARSRAKGRPGAVGESNDVHVTDVSDRVDSTVAAEAAHARLSREIYEVDRVLKAAKRQGNDAATRLDAARAALQHRNALVRKLTTWMMDAAGHLSAHTPRIEDGITEDDSNNNGSEETNANANATTTTTAACADDEDDDGGKHAAADVAHAHLSREIYEVERVIKVRLCDARLVM